jgi:N-acetyl sugar amidotransferase
MDTTDSDIHFDGDGICNHCRAYDAIAARYIFTGEYAKKELDRIVNEIKSASKNKDYDCVIGLSGGADSSYSTYWAHKLGLRVLVVHVDNGWNSEVAVRNIERIVKKLNMDLYTHVIDWEEFKDLQLAFLRASVLDVEVLTDNAISAVLSEITDKRKIRYLLKGSNVATEGIMPPSWSYSKIDSRNIKAIHSRFGKKEINTYPIIGPFKHKIYYPYFKRIRSVNVLNYVPYVKKDAIAVLEKEFDWKYYGDKHYESIFTRFYHAYILPTKFNIDTRKPHLSTLIASGQMTRNQALEILQKDPYTPEELREEKEYIISKLGLTEEEFDDIMNLPVKFHWDYPSYRKLRIFAIKMATMLGIRQARHSSTYKL